MGSGERAAEKESAVGEATDDFWKTWARVCRERREQEQAERDARFDELRAKCAPPQR
jgi:hypothetical protein